MSGDAGKTRDRQQLSDQYGQLVSDIPNRSTPDWLPDWLLYDIEGYLTRRDSEAGFIKGGFQENKNHLDMVFKIINYKSFEELYREMFRTYSEDPPRFYHQAKREIISEVGAPTLAGLGDMEFQRGCFYLVFLKIIEIHEFACMVGTKEQWDCLINLLRYRAEILEEIADESHESCREDKNGEIGIQYMREKASIYRSRIEEILSISEAFTVKNRRQNNTGLGAAIIISDMLFWLFGKKFSRISAMIAEEATGEVVTEDQVKERWKALGEDD